jgi:squalene synthase HpnC
MPTPDAIREAFAHCVRMAGEHYENFPVASRLLPRKQRPYVAAIYAFARTADDFADEGNAPADERLDRLHEWENRLLAATRGNAEGPVFIALAETMAQTGLPSTPLRDLLTAFRMDVTTTRYESFQDLLHYCRHSANPVGRIILFLFNQATEENTSLSDSICTGLQLANFWQDLGVDWKKGRLYVPLEDLRRFGYNEAELTAGVADSRFRNLMKFEVERARQYLLAGMPLPRLVRTRLRWELALTVRGGLRILDSVEDLDYDVLHRRPALKTSDAVRLVFDTVLNRAP